MNQAKLIRYVGKKARKKDTVADTGTVWAGPGDVQEVEHGAAVKLLEHPDVWVEHKAGAKAPKAPATDDSSEGGDPDDLLQAVKDAVLGLDRENADHFTDKGKPKLEAVRETVPEATVQALNAAWKEIDG